MSILCNRWLRRICALVLSLCVTPIFAIAESEEIDPRKEPFPYPDALMITVAYETRKADNGVSVEVGVPTTNHEKVNDELSTMVQTIFEDTAAHAGVNKEEELEVMTTYRVSGTKWAGLMITGRVITLANSSTKSFITEDTTYLCFDSVTYDMETGERLTMADVFPDDSEAWAKISGMMQEQLNAYYPSESRDQEAIAALTDIEAIKQMSFLPGAGRLLLTVPLWDVLDQHLQLVQIALPYPDFRQWMTETAYEQTDNSARPIVAITYDDGPAQHSTRNILRSLSSNGAAATFFTVGRMLNKWPDIVRRELDYGHTVGSHSYHHKYEYQVNTDYLRDDREQCLQFHEEMLGIQPDLFRAPGGNCDKYQKYEIGWPIILWRYSAGDTGNNNAYQLASRIANGAKDGDIILMHDIYAKTAKGSDMFLAQMREAGFMFATVEEMLYLHGIVPQPNVVYHSAFTEPITAAD